MLDGIPNLVGFAYSRCYAHVFLYYFLAFAISIVAGLLSAVNLQIHCLPRYMLGLCYPLHFFSRNDAISVISVLFSY